MISIRMPLFIDLYGRYYVVSSRSPLEDNTPLQVARNFSSCLLTMGALPGNCPWSEGPAVLKERQQRQWLTNDTKAWLFCLFWDNRGHPSSRAPCKVIKVSVVMALRARFSPCSVLSFSHPQTYLLRKHDLENSLSSSSESETVSRGCKWRQSETWNLNKLFVLGKRIFEANAKGPITSSQLPFPSVVLYRLPPT